MAELIVKEIANPFRQEEKISKIELNLYSKLLNKKKETNDNCDIAKDLYSQLIDMKESKTNLRN